MLWYMKGSGNCEGTVFWLTHSKGQLSVEFSVGRAGCKLNIPNDRTVSRKHAVIKLLQIQPSGSGRSSSSSGPVYKFLVSDVSTVGTFVNDMKLPKGQSQSAQVNEGDVIRFGGLHSIFLVCSESVVAVMSSMPHSDKVEVHRLVTDVVHGHCIKEWSRHATHLVMNRINVTAKVLGCLICQKPIVSPRYFQDWKDNISQHKAKPNCNDYVPQMVESSITIGDNSDISFLPNPARANIFSSTTCLTFSRQQASRLRSVVELAGGKVRLCPADDDVSGCDVGDITDSDLLSGRCLVIDHQQHQPPGSSDASTSSSQAMTNTQPSSPTLSSITDRLQSLKLRLVTETEISLAVLHACRDKFCNPQRLQRQEGSDACAAATRPGERAVEESAEVLAEETQSEELLQSPRTAHHDVNENNIQPQGEQSDRQYTGSVITAEDDTKGNLPTNVRCVHSDDSGGDPTDSKKPKLSAFPAIDSSSVVGETNSNAVSEDIPACHRRKRAASDNLCKPKDSGTTSGDATACGSKLHPSAVAALDSEEGGRFKRPRLVGDHPLDVVGEVRVKEEPVSSQPSYSAESKDVKKVEDGDGSDWFDSTRHSSCYLQLPGFLSKLSVKQHEESSVAGDGGGKMVPSALSHNVSTYSVRDDDLPRDVCEVEVVVMVRPRIKPPAPPPPPPQLNTNTTTGTGAGILNYKKFRKQSIPSGEDDYVPRIIGRNDLIQNPSQSLAYNDLQIANEIYEAEAQGQVDDKIFDDLEASLAASVNKKGKKRRR